MTTTPSDVGDPVLAAGSTVRARRGAGLFLALASGALFGTSGTFGDGLLRSGWSPGAAVLARIVVAALTLTPFALPRLRRQRAALRRNARQVLGYGLIGVLGCTFCYFYSIASIPVGIGLLLEYTAAFMVVMWLWLRHGQRPRALTIGGTAAAIGGLAVMAGVTGAGGLNPAGLAWGLGAAVCMTVFMFICESPPSPAAPEELAGSPGSPPEELSPVMLTWTGLCVAAVTLAAAGAAGAVPMAATTAPVSFLGHPVSWIWPVLAVGALSTGAAFITAVAAVRALGAKLATFLGMSEVLFSVAFAALMLSQVPTATQFAGGALILLGCALVRADER
ncbi:MAG: DMT family transporter [Streptosporangiales bacterium]|nr:DMT family transporter [Streptosporangiales bacterium]